MAKEFLNPPSLSTPVGYTHVVSARGRTIVTISGQIATDADGAIVGRGDLREQTKRVFENLGHALAAAGATFGDVVKLNYYVVNFQPDERAVIREIRRAYLSPDHPPASTLVGVTALAMEGLLIEIEATAVLE